MAATTKKMMNLNGDQVLSYSYNETGAICTEGWVTGLVGRRIEYSYGTTTVAGDTAFFTYKENGVTMLVLANVYQDGTRQVLLSTERIS